MFSKLKLRFKRFVELYFWLCSWYHLSYYSYFQTYLVGQAMSLAGPDIMEPTTKFNNYRIYGTFLLVKSKVTLFIFMFSRNHFYVNCRPFLGSLCSLAWNLWISLPAWLSSVSWLPSVQFMSGFLSTSKEITRLSKFWRLSLLNKKFLP